MAAFLSRRLVSASLALLMTCLVADRGNAAVVVNVSQEGNDVVARATGSINLAGLHLSHTNFSTHYVRPVGGHIFVGSGSQSLTVYTGAFGPASFGSGGTVLASFGSGTLIGISGQVNSIFVPASYVSGTSIDSSATWTNRTLAGLGFAQGTYTYNWGSGGNADSLTIVVPEPSTLAIAGLAVATRRRRR